MKNIIKYAVYTLFVSLMFAACSPQEFDDYDLGSLYTVSADKLSFEITPNGADEWTYNYTASIADDPVKTPFSYEIRFKGNDYYVATKDLEGTQEFKVLAGNYTAELCVFTPNGEITSIARDINFKNDNPKFFQDDPQSPQFILTGGKDNLEGKEWKLKQGATGLGPADGTWGEWWQIGEPTLFNDVFVFKPNSIQPNGQFVYDNMGDTYMNESLGDMFPDGDPTGSFTTLAYTPPTDANWVIENRNGTNWLVINKGFIGYPVTQGDLDRTEYEILAFTPSSIDLKYHGNGNAWFFFLTSERPQEVVYLTGEGTKTWVFDVNNKHVAEVVDATPEIKNIKGAIGLGSIGGYQEWWGAGPGEKSEENAGWTLEYTKYIFSDNGKLTIETRGEGYGRGSAGVPPGGGSINAVEGDDILFGYNGGEFDYTLSEDQIVLGEGGFLIYYVQNQDYEIVYLSETALCVRVVNINDGQDWVFILTPEGQQ